MERDASQWCACGWHRSEPCRCRAVIAGLRSALAERDKRVAGLEEERDEARMAWEAEREKRKQQDQREASILDDLSQSQQRIAELERERDEARATLEAIRLEVCCPEGGDLQEHVTQLVEKVATGALRQRADLAQARQRIKELEATRSEALAVSAKRVIELYAEQLEPEE